jgi:hypothetical protein
MIEISELDGKRPLLQILVYRTAKERRESADTRRKISSHYVSSTFKDMHMIDNLASLS